jgi:hypothetical protein
VKPRSRPGRFWRIFVFELSKNFTFFVVQIWVLEPEAVKVLVQQPFEWCNLLRCAPRSLKLRTYDANGYRGFEIVEVGCRAFRVP